MPAGCGSGTMNVPAGSVRESRRIGSSARCTVMPLSSSVRTRRAVWPGSPPGGSRYARVGPAPALRRNSTKSRSIFSRFLAAVAAVIIAEVKWRTAPSR